MLLAASLVVIATPTVSAGVPVWSCTSLRSSTCSSLLCFAVSQQVPFCLPVTTRSDPPSATCSEIVASGAAGASCTVGSKTYTVATCQACYPAFYVVCTENTDLSYGCHSNFIVLE